MIRRTFIAVLGAAAMLRPMTAAAQVARKRRIGILLGADESDIDRQAYLGAFRDRLAELGWTAERNITYVERWAGSSADRIRAYARELIALAPDLVLTHSVQLVTALRDETRTIPIVFGTASDPMEVGLVGSLTRPGGNITGFMSIAAETNVKYLELIKSFDPRLARVLVLMSSKDPSNLGRFRGIEAGGLSLGLSVAKADVSGPADIADAIAAFAAQPAGALICLPSPVTNTHYKTIIAEAAQHRLPAIYPRRYQADEGGLMAYDANQIDQFRRAASYADRILRGEKPGNLPIQAPVKFELVVNLKTAKALGTEFPPMLLAQAHDVIE